MKRINVGINGACGRMGHRLIALASRDPDLHVSLAIDAEGHADMGRDAGEVSGIGTTGIQIGSTIPLKARLDVLIDFSQPEGTMQVLKSCCTRQIPILIATTGHTAEQRREIATAS